MVPSLPGRAVTSRRRRTPRLAPHSGSSLEHALNEQGYVRSSIGTFRSQDSYSQCSRKADPAGCRATPRVAAPQRMLATRESRSASSRLNPCAGGASIRPPPAKAGKPTPEERHGQGSDAQQQGKEEAEGGVEQEEKGRPRPLAVRFGTGAAPAGPESLRQEELTARGRDASARHCGLGRLATAPCEAGHEASA